MEVALHLVGLQADNPADQTASGHFGDKALMFSIRSLETEAIGNGRNLLDEREDLLRWFYNRQWLS